MSSNESKNKILNMMAVEQLKISQSLNKFNNQEGMLLNEWKNEI